MPCPDGLTERQCKLRDALAKKLEKHPNISNAWALATHTIQQKAKAKRGTQ